MSSTGIQSGQSHNGYEDQLVGIRLTDGMTTHEWSESFGFQPFVIGLTNGHPTGIQTNLTNGNQTHNGYTDWTDEWESD